MVVRPLVVAPAQVHPHARRVDPPCGVVEHVDVEFRPRDELVVGEVLESGVPRHRQVRAVELEVEAGPDDRLVLDLHRIAHRSDVVVVGCVVLVRLERGHEAGRRSVHEAGIDADRVHRCQHVHRVRRKVGVADVLDRPDTRLAAKGLTPAVRRCHPYTQFGVRSQVERGPPGRIAVEPRHPILDVGGVRDLGHLAVGRYVDADLVLPANDVTDGGGHRRGELVVERSGLARREQPRDRRWAGQ